MVMQVKAAEEQTAVVSATTFPMSLDEPSNDEAQETLRESKGAAVDEESQSASSDLHRLGPYHMHAGKGGNTKCVSLKSSVLFRV